MIEPRPKNTARVALVVGPAVENRALGREARGDVHVPVGPVAQALAHVDGRAREPDEVAHTEVVRQHRFDRLQAHPGVAVRVCDRALRRHEGARAIDLDRKP